MRKKDKILGVVGDLEWNELKELLIHAFKKCQTEEDFCELLSALNKGVGTEKDIKKRRKEFKMEVDETLENQIKLIKKSRTRDDIKFFNEDGKNLQEILGITPEEDKLIIKQVSIAVLKFMSSGNKAKSMQYIWNNRNLRNDIVMIVLIFLGEFFAKYEEDEKLDKGVKQLKKIKDLFDNGKL